MEKSHHDRNQQNTSGMNYTYFFMVFNAAGFRAEMPEIAFPKKYHYIL